VLEIWKGSLITFQPRIIGCKRGGASTKECVREDACAAAQRSVCEKMLVLQRARSVGEGERQAQAREASPFPAFWGAGGAVRVIRNHRCVVDGN
jgi:hypothetical protein